MLWLDRGIVRRLDKGYGEFESWSNDIIEREATERHKLDRLIERETEWAGKSIRARRTRNEGRLRALKALREQRRQQIGPVGRATIEVGQAEASGALVVTARNITKRWGDKVIVEDFSTRIFRKNRIGLIGPNGAGKTTLLRMLIGELEPDSGTVKLGANLMPVVIDQRRIGLDPEKTPWETLADRNDHVLVRGRLTHVMTYLREYLFRDEQARQAVGTAIQFRVAERLVATQQCHRSRPSRHLGVEQADQSGGCLVRCGTGVRPDEGEPFVVCKQW